MPWYATGGELMPHMVLRVMLPLRGTIGADGFG
jgi:hypothetical protein